MHSPTLDTETQRAIVSGAVLVWNKQQGEAKLRQGGVMPSQGLTQQISAQDKVTVQETRPPPPDMSHSPSASVVGFRAAGPLEMLFLFCQQEKWETEIALFSQNKVTGLLPRTQVTFITLPPDPIFSQISPSC